MSAIKLETIGIDLGRVSLEGVGYRPRLSVCAAGHNCTEAAFSGAAYNAGRPNFSGPV
jgi:hypothetical protein